MLSGRQQCHDWVRSKVSQQRERVRVQANSQKHTHTKVTFLAILQNLGSSVKVEVDGKEVQKGNSVKLRAGSHILFNGEDYQVQQG